MNVSSLLLSAGFVSTPFFCVCLCASLETKTHQFSFCTQPAVLVRSLTRLLSSHLFSFHLPPGVDGLLFALLLFFCSSMFESVNVILIVEEHEGNPWKSSVHMQMDSSEKHLWGGVEWWVPRGRNACKRDYWKT